MDFFFPSRSRTVETKPVVEEEEQVEVVVADDFCQPLDDDAVEELLSNKLMEGFMLMSDPCPVCSTPLVKRDDDAEDRENVSSKDDAVAYCVSCRAHVVANEKELKILESKQRSTILMAIHEEAVASPRNVKPTPVTNGTMKATSLLAKSRGRGFTRRVMRARDRNNDPAEQSTTDDVEVEGLEVRLKATESTTDSQSFKEEHVAADESREPPETIHGAELDAGEEEQLRDDSSDEESAYAEINVYRQQSDLDSMEELTFDGTHMRHTMHKVGATREPYFDERKELAAKILTAKILQGYTLEEQPCPVCRMPLICNNEDHTVSCAVCPVLQKKKAQPVSTPKSSRKAEILKNPSIRLERDMHSIKKAVHENKSSALDRVRALSAPTHKAAISPANSAATKPPVYPPNAPTPKTPSVQPPIETKPSACISKEDYDKLQSRQIVTSVVSMSDKSVEDIRKDFEVKRAIACKHVRTNMAHGWILLDETCPDCDMPMMAPHDGAKGECTLCGTMAEMESVFSNSTSLNEFSHGSSGSVSCTTGEDSSTMKTSQADPATQDLESSRADAPFLSSLREGDQNNSTSHDTPTPKHRTGRVVAADGDKYVGAAGSHIIQAIARQKNSRSADPPAVSGYTLRKNLLEPESPYFDGGNLRNDPPSPNASRIIDVSNHDEPIDTRQYETIANLVSRAKIFHEKKASGWSDARSSASQHLPSPGMSTAHSPQLFAEGDARTPTIASEDKPKELVDEDESIFEEDSVAEDAERLSAADSMNTEALDLLLERIEDTQNALQCVGHDKQKRSDLSKLLATLLATAEQMQRFDDIELGRNW